jgi:hypothetical protein
MMIKCLVAILHKTLLREGGRKREREKERKRRMGK